MVDDDDNDDYGVLFWLMCQNILFLYKNHKKEAFNYLYDPCV